MALLPMTITGNLTRDPWLKKLQSGTCVGRLRVAASRRVRDEKAESGWRDVDTLFINVELWGQLAVNVRKSLLKGMPVIVTGFPSPGSGPTGKATPSSRSSSGPPRSAWTSPATSSAPGAASRPSTTWTTSSSPPSTVMSTSTPSRSPRRPPTPSGRHWPISRGRGSLILPRMRPLSRRRRGSWWVQPPVMVRGRAADRRSEIRDVPFGVT